VNSKELILLLSAVATIVACIFTILFGAPPAIIAIRQLISDSSPNVAQGASTPSLLATLPSDVATQQPTIVVATQAPSAANATQTASIVPATRTPTISRPTSTRTVTRPPAPPPPNCASGSLAGKVASDIPGTRLCIGIAVSSVVDSNTKRRDVYSIDLVAGQEVRFTSTSRGCVNYRVLNPSSTSIESSRVSEAFSARCEEQWQANFTPAVSGTYYLEVEARGTGQTYTLSLKNTGLIIPGNLVQSDIPGTRLALGSTVSSVVDSNTKRRDVYSIDLVVGQEVRFTSTSRGCVNYRVLNPSSTSIESSRVSEAFSARCEEQWQANFTPAISGTYYLEVEARGTGQTYTLSVKVLR